MSSATVIWKVAQREIKARMLTRANIVSMIVIVVLIAAAAVVAHYVMNRTGEPEATRVALAQEVDGLRDDLEAVAAERDIDLEIATLTAQEAETALVDAPEGQEPIDAFLDGDPRSPRMLVASTPDDQVLDLVSTAVQSHARTEVIQELGGDPETFGQALAAAVPQVQAVEEPDDEFDGAAFAVAIVMMALLFGSLVSTGSVMAMGVVEEKTSRIVEILLATIRPTQLLAGKIFGVGVYGLAQVAVIGGALALAGWSLGIDGPDLNIGSALIWVFVWFLVGYLLYALLFGGFASLVSRQEDIGSVTTPLMFLLLAPFYTTMFLVPNDPDSTAVRILSLIPFFSPFMMPVRDAFGAVEPWEIALSLAIALVTIPALIWLAARVYRRAVLHTGGKMKLTDALRG